MIQASLFSQDIPPVLSSDGWTGHASFSGCMTYRYTLSRTWDDGDGSALVVMLNPSTADDAKNDPTVERVCRTLRAAGMNRLTVTNLFAFRTPYPEELVKASRNGVDIVGPDNDKWIAHAATDARMVLVAWGSCSAAPKLAKAELLALRTTGDDAPSHPLYLPKSLVPQPYAHSRLWSWIMSTGKTKP